MNLRPLVVTGPIGSGKSTVSKLLEGFGALRVDLDQLSREVLETRAGRRFVTTHWPQVVSHAGVDRTALGRLVFGDHSQLRRLEEFVHPLVLATYKATFGGQSPLVVEVSVPFSISIESGFVALIDTPRETRFARLLERGMSAGDIEARMDSQPGRKEWLGLAGAVISNHQSESDLVRDVGSFWAWWREL